MTYTTQGLMTPADLADHEQLTDTGPNPHCPGHVEEAAFGVPQDSTVYCSRAENCPDTDRDSLLRAVAVARRELDQQHPWIPGGAFQQDARLKPLLLEALDRIAAEA